MLVKWLCCFYSLAYAINYVTIPSHAVTIMETLYAAEKFFACKNNLYSKIWHICYFYIFRNILDPQFNSQLTLD